MAKTIIVSHETLCGLLEAHASMAAWYYALSSALQAAGGTIDPPDEQQRVAFLAELARQFPEVAELAGAIPHPQPYVPPPIVATPPSAPLPIAAASEEPALAEPARVEAEAAPEQAEDADADDSIPPSTMPESNVPPPPMVDPNKVKYE